MGAFYPQKFSSDALNQQSFQEPLKIQRGRSEVSMNNTVVFHFRRPILGLFKARLSNVKKRGWHYYSWDYTVVLRLKGTWVSISLSSPSISSLASDPPERGKKTY